jgi:hypothetical protein
MPRAFPCSDVSIDGMPQAYCVQGCPKVPTFRWIRGRAADGEAGPLEHHLVAFLDSSVGVGPLHRILVAHGEAGGC